MSRWVAVSVTLPPMLHRLSGSNNLLSHKGDSAAESLEARGRVYFREQHQQLACVQQRYAAQAALKDVIRFELEASTFLVIVKPTESPKMGNHFAIRAAGQNRQVEAKVQKTQ